MDIHVPIDEEQLQAFCARWQITSFALLGSVLREDFRPDSDIDVLVTFAPESRLSLFGLARIAIELEDLFGREVDLVERGSVEQSYNPIRRKEILSTAQEVYRAAA